MTIRTRISKLEQRPPVDARFAERLDRLRAKLAADGIELPRREYPPELRGLAEKLSWARAQLESERLQGVAPA